MSLPNGVELVVRFPVNDRALSELHAQAFGYPVEAPDPWAARLERYSVSWIGAFRGADLVGFVHACGDGGLHAFLLDTIVRPDQQRRGIARALVSRLVEEVAAAGCAWLHVDYVPEHAAFYEGACGFRPTPAGLIRLP